MITEKFTVLVLLIFLCMISFFFSLHAKEFRYKHYTFRKKQRLAKKYSPLEKGCEVNQCKDLFGLELIKCTRKCISQTCYDELYAWDELEEGEIDVRLTSFKGCVVKQLQEQESRNRGL
ncbi:unnamed protein product [Porites evermanni]|uniref:Uncharacterized protein n=2 Tax=Porites TaxID=46719 RepID=A0ABN8PUJ0_9CNID|nr:unnamed protein product [Porites lobata]CAH3156296.1 unnamed protein product [Porites evermanni]